jgi:hypothetical protein
MSAEIASAKGSLLHMPLSVTGCIETPRGCAERRILAYGRHALRHRKPEIRSADVKPAASAQGLWLSADARQSQCRGRATVEIDCQIIAGNIRSA